MENKMKINFGLDAAMTVLLVIMQLPQATGVELHRWVGMLFGVGLLVHVALHSKWTMATAKSFSNPLPAQVRINFLLTMLMAFLFAVTILSGILNSPMPIDRASPHGVFVWHAIHAISSRLALVVVVLHLVVHRKWIANAIRPRRSSTFQVGPF